MPSPETLIILWLTVLYLLVVWYDGKSYIIPNWLNLLIMASYPLLLLAGWPEPWWGGLAAFGAMLAVGMVFFFLGIMGGGDVKLLTVSMLWTGWGDASLQFIIFTAFAGGALALAVLIIRRLVVPVVVRLKPNRTIARIWQRGQPIPYGLAIAAAFIGLLWMGFMPGLKVAI